MLGQLARSLFFTLFTGVILTLVFFYLDHSHNADQDSLIDLTIEFGLIASAIILSVQLMQLFLVRRLLNANAERVHNQLDKLTQVNQEINEEITQTTLALNMERNQAQRILDHTQAIIMTLQRDGSIASINNYGEQITGFAGRELRGKNFVDLYKERNGLAMKDLHQMALTLDGKRSTYRHESTMTMRDGRDRIILWLHSNLNPENSNEHLLLSVGLDITEQKQLENKLSWLADHDSLTSLFNRRRFETELEQAMEWAHGNDAPCALMYLDLDNFKDVNDSCGHQVGDGILIQAAKRLSRQLRDIEKTCKPVLARIGGDEFAVILRDIDEEAVSNLCQRILDNLATIHHDNANIRFQLSGSIGVAIFPGTEKGLNDLLSIADHAMYQAKALGKNRFHIFQQNDISLLQTQNRIVWREKIESALQHKRFELHYQPILDIQKRSISHYETLVRLRDDNDHLVSPETFITMAETLGIIHEIDLFIVDSAIRKQAELTRQGHDITLAINLSGKAFDNHRLYDSIVEALHKYNARADRLIFEITETAALSDILAAEKIMARIQALGCQFALDDFGVGFSSFYYLRELPVEYVKIDGSFIKDLVNNADNLVLVKALSEVAIGFNKLSVAEFVDSLQTLHILSEARVNYAQGYFIGKPSQTIPVAPPNFYQASVLERTSVMR